MYYQEVYDSPVGKMIMVSYGEHLNGLWIEGQSGFTDAVKEGMQPKEELSVFIMTKEWLDRYFAGDKPKISELPLQLSGTEFRKEVWKLLCEIPYGETTTYGEIAKKMAKKRNKAKMSAQAVGNAVGHNPVSIIVPCHRVIGSDGGMTGYGGGIAKKVWLLNHEGVSVEEKRCVGMKRR